MGWRLQIGKARDCSRLQFSSPISNFNIFYSHHCADLETIALAISTTAPNCGSLPFLPRPRSLHAAVVVSSPARLSEHFPPPSRNPLALREDFFSSSPADLLPRRHSPAESTGGPHARSSTVHGVEVFQHEKIGSFAVAEAHSARLRCDSRRLRKLKRPGGRVLRTPSPPGGGGRRDQDLVQHQLARTRARADG